MFLSTFFANIPGHVLTTLVELTQCNDQTVGHGGRHKKWYGPRTIRQGKDQAIRNHNIR